MEIKDLKYITFHCTNTAFPYNKTLLIFTISLWQIDYNIIIILKSYSTVLNEGKSIFINRLLTTKEALYILWERLNS